MNNNNTLETMLQSIKSQRPGMVVGMVSMGVFALIGFVWTATTISTNISTDGDLTVNGSTTLGNATSTDTVTASTATTTWTLPGTGLFNLLAGNFKIGNGTPDVSLNGEDAYVEGTFEVDGASRFDGNVTITSSAALLLGSDGNASSVTTTGGAVWYDGSNFYGNANGTATQLDNASGGSSEIWKTGVSSLTSASAQQGTSINTAILSLTTSTLYLGPATSEKTIQSIKYIIISDTGSYSGNVTLAANIVNTSGVVQHTAATTVGDMEGQTNGAWTTMTLGSGADITIGTNEFLRLRLGGDSGNSDDLNMMVIYEAVLQ